MHVLVVLQNDGGRRFMPYGEGYGTGDEVTMMLDSKSGTLSFRLNGQHQGVAFAKDRVLQFLAPHAAQLVPAVSLGGKSTYACASIGIIRC